MDNLGRTFLVAVRSKSNSTGLIIDGPGEISAQRTAEDIRFLQPIARLTQADSPFNPVRPLPDVGGSPLLHGVEIKEVDVFLPL